jgi:uncharacterized protein (DUF1684 family)
MSHQLLDLADWRRRVSELYAAVREETHPGRAHRIWQAGRLELFQTHPQSPLKKDDPLRTSGIDYWPYDPRFCFELELLTVDEPQELRLPTDGDGTTRLQQIGRVRIPLVEPVTVDVWWLEQYAGGIFLPLRDGTSGRETYGGGRYLLDTAKGADLGGSPDTLIVDLNFLYHPSCRYNAAWQCPLAPAGNTIREPVRAGERL